MDPGDRVEKKGLTTAVGTPEQVDLTRRHLDGEGGGEGSAVEGKAGAPDSQHGISAIMNGVRLNRPKGNRDINAELN
jgi:hypothetical protein